MFHKGKELKKYGIHATDGNIGTVHDFFFDDKHWTTRYLVIDTIKWLPGRKVLVSPMSIQKVDVLDGKVNVSLSKDKVKNSPEMDTDKPVSKQYEMELGKYYGYPPYWSAGGTGLWGVYWYPSELAEKEAKNLAEYDNIEEVDKPNLRSLKEVTGYHIHATDGDIGHVEDFLICDQTWMIRYIVVDTKNWWPGKHVLVSPEWITEVRWRENTVHVELTKEMIKNGPEYIPNERLTREFEDNLYEKYNKPKYWL